MLERWTEGLQFQGAALQLRTRRQELLSSNVANADTPRFQARDFDFPAALQASLREQGVVVSPQVNGSKAIAPVQSVRMVPVHTTALAHLPGTRGAGGSGFQPDLEYRRPIQGSVDGNTVDMDRERATFADNAVRIEATVRFLSGSTRTLLSAIKGE